MREIGQNEAEAEAANLPLPDFEDETEALWVAEQFVLARKKSFACSVLRLGRNVGRREWLNYKRDWQESKRFRLWCDRVGARWDAARGKYLATLTE